MSNLVVVIPPPGDDPSHAKTPSPHRHRYKTLVRSPDFHLSGSPTLLATLRRTLGTIRSTDKFYRDLKKVYDAECAHIDNLSIKNGLNRGLEIAHAYSQLHDVILSVWFDRVVRTSPESVLGNVSLVAVGRYGAEILPHNGDVDIRLLYECGATSESDPENAQFNDHLQSQCRQLQAIMPRVCFPCPVNNIRDIEIEDPSIKGYFDDEKFCSFLDVRVIAGSKDLVKEARKLFEAHSERRVKDSFLAKIRDVQQWEEQFVTTLTWADDYDLKYGVGGLRRVDAALWARCLERFIPTQTVYPTLPTDVRDAFETLLAVRNWLGLRKKLPSDSTHKDKVNLSDFHALHQDFGDDGLHRFYQARATINLFFKDTITRMLSAGIPVEPGIRYGVHGLFFDGTAEAIYPDRTARFFALKLSALRHQLPIDVLTQRTVDETSGEAIRAHPLFLTILGELRNVVETVKELADIQILQRLIPHWSILASRLYPGKHRSRGHTQASRSFERLKTLEHLGTTREKGLIETTAFDPTFEYFQKLYLSTSAEMRTALRIALLSVDVVPERPANGRQRNEQVQEWCVELKKNYPSIAQPILEMVEFLMMHKSWLVHFVERSDADIAANSIRCKEYVAVRSRLDLLTLFSLACYDYGQKLNADVPPRRSAQHWEATQQLHRATKELFPDEVVTQESLSPLRLPTSVEIDVHGDLCQDAEFPKIFAACPNELKRFVGVKNLIRTHFPRIQAAYTKPEVVTSYNFNQSGNEVSLMVYFPNYRGALLQMLNVFEEQQVHFRSSEIFTLADAYPVAVDILKLKRTNLSETPAAFKSRITAALRDALLAKKVERFAGDESTLASIRSGFSDPILTRLVNNGPYSFSLVTKEAPGFLRSTISILYAKLDAEVISYRRRIHGGDSEARTRTLLFRSHKSESEVLAVMAEHFGVAQLKRNV